MRPTGLGTHLCPTVSKCITVLGRFDPSRPVAHNFTGTHELCCYPKRRKFNGGKYVGIYKFIFFKTKSKRGNLSGRKYVGIYKFIFLKFIFLIHLLRKYYETSAEYFHQFVDDDTSNFLVLTILTIQIHTERTDQAQLSSAFSLRNSVLCKKKQFGESCYHIRDIRYLN